MNVRRLIKVGVILSCRKPLPKSAHFPRELLTLSQKSYEAAGILAIMLDF
jgi:hypothetical protein